jgi:putative membrane protein
VIVMNTLLYFVVMAAAFMGLSQVLPGFRVAGWVPAVFGAIILAAANTVVKPVLFVLTLPFTIVTLGLFLLVLNALMLGLTAWVVPGVSISGWGTTFIASLILSAVGMVWKAVTKEEKNRKTKDL